MSLTPQITNYLQQIKLPDKASHKGQNGKLLIIGGSHLFHAASKWSLDIASELVDMVFYASVPSNNELMQEAKGQFWNGLVIGRDQISEYAQEADCILIGPGMDRSSETQTLTNEVIKHWPTKKWVIDAGALQMMDVNLLNQNCIITPHLQEFVKVYRKAVMLYTQKNTDGSLHGEFEGESWDSAPEWKSEDSLWFEEAIVKSISEYDDLDKAGHIGSQQLKNYLLHFSKILKGTTVIIKGRHDFVFQFKNNYDDSVFEVVAGGNPGMTKGGTGDVLAGLVAGLYATQDQLTAAVVGSYINKQAGDALYQTVGPFFNASQLVTEIPQQLWAAIKRANEKN